MKRHYSIILRSTLLPLDVLQGRNIERTFLCTLCVFTDQMKERFPLRRTIFRRSGIGRIEKARARTLKMTIVIGKRKSLITLPVNPLLSPIASKSDILSLL